MTGYEVARRHARLAYELARLRTGAGRALLLACLVAIVAFVSFGSPGLAWLPLTVAAWTGIEWRGGALLRGGRVGVGVGFAALAMPLWAFRTCCRAGETMVGDCCTMIGTCTAVGAVLGLTLAVFLVRAPREQRAETALGMGAAVLAVATVRCAELLAGEALGLLGGIAAGALASALVSALVARARAT